MVWARGENVKRSATTQYVTVYVTVTYRIELGGGGEAPGMKAWDTVLGICDIWWCDLVMVALPVPLVPGLKAKSVGRQGHGLGEEENKGRSPLTQHV